MIDEKKFRVALIENGLSQTRLAQSLGLHPAVMSAIVRGFRRTNFEIEERIAASLGLSREALFPQKDLRLMKD